ncbi:MAG TPA: hypothetical protein VEV84_03800 [Pyrinomonadaceae bacterium]|nr:hypothetical protein [Pyrinomonadaceae bacterium]
MPATFQSSIGHVRLQLGEHPRFQDINTMFLLSIYFDGVNVCRYGKGKAAAVFNDKVVFLAGNPYSEFRNQPGLRRRALCFVSPKATDIKA